MLLPKFTLHLVNKSAGVLQKS